MPSFHIQCSKCSFKLTYAPSNHFLLKRLIYDLGGGAIAPVMHTISWCYQCKDFCLIEKIPSQDEILDALNHYKSNLLCEEVFKGDCVFAKEIVQSENAWREFARSRLVSTIKCLHCGSASIESHTKFDYQHSNLISNFKHPDCGGFLSVYKQEIWLSTPRRNLDFELPRVKFSREGVRLTSLLGEPSIAQFSLTSSEQKVAQVRNDGLDDKSILPAPKFLLGNLVNSTLVPSDKGKTANVKSGGESISQVILVGLKDGQWKFITDGSETFIAATDIRHHSEPPSIKVNAYRNTFEISAGSNRIERSFMTPEEIRRYCLIENIELKCKSDLSNMVERSFAPMALAGGLGAVVGGLVGAAVGVSLAGWVSSDSDFSGRRLADKFRKATENCHEWELFDIEHERLKLKTISDYAATAKKKWDRFHKLSNLSSADNFSGREFELAVCQIYEKKGYRVTLTQVTGDFGIDLIAEKGKEKLTIQAKRYIGKVGIKAVQEAASGALYYGGSKAVVITNSSYTQSAKELAHKLQVQLIDRERLAILWMNVNSDDVLPPFEMQSYELMKPTIDQALNRLDFPTRKGSKRRTHKF